MKKNTALFLLPVILFTAFLPGCVKDKCEEAHTYTYYTAVYKTTSQVRANIKSNPARQVQNPGKLYIRGNYIFLNELNRGIHVINNSNPANPVNVAFIDIPGNLDVAVKGNTLYADLYTDLVTIDITDPLNVVVKKFTENIFPRHFWGWGFTGANDTSKVVVDWVKRDTTVMESCNERSWLMAAGGDVFMANGAAGGAASASPFGMGGSMARFAVVNNNLYSVNNTDLNVFNISTPNDPLYVRRTSIGGWNIETIYPFRDKLFIGSRNGMFVYSLANPDNPEQTGQFAHVSSCDPVIADDHHAFVTLRSGNECQGFTNQMEVLTLTIITNPILVKTYPLTNPHGLSKDGNTLFICDGAAGLKIYNASNVSNLQLLKTIVGMETYDVIAYNNRALVVAKDGLYQYDYTDLNNIRLLSKINVVK